jgi:hypothetical protein
MEQGDRMHATSATTENDRTDDGTPVFVISHQRILLRRAATAAASSAQGP